MRGEPSVGVFEAPLFLLLRLFDRALFPACFLAFGSAFLRLNAPGLGFADDRFVGNGLNFRRAHFDEDDECGGNEEDEEDGGRFQHGRTPRGC